jgi:hypothetical protein
MSLLGLFRQSQGQPQDLSTGEVDFSQLRNFVEYKLFLTDTGSLGTEELHISRLAMPSLVRLPRC